MKVTAKDIELEASTLKVVVFMETAPLSDTFEQVMLTEKQAKAVRDAIWMRMPKCECGSFNISTQDEQYTFKDIRDEFDESEFEKPEPCCEAGAGGTV